MAKVQTKAEATTARPIELARAFSASEVEIAEGKFMEKTYNPYEKITRAIHEAYHGTGVPHVHMGGQSLVVMLG